MACKNCGQFEELTEETAGILAQRYANKHNVTMIVTKCKCFAKYNIYEINYAEQNGIKILSIHEPQ